MIQQILICFSTSIKAHSRKNLEYNYRFKDNKFLIHIYAHFSCQNSIYSIRTQKNYNFLQTNRKSQYIPEAPDIEALDPLIITKKQLIFHYKITKGIAFICLLEFDEAARVLIQIKFNGHSKADLFHHLCTIYQHKSLIKPQLLNLVRQRIYEAYNIEDNAIQNKQTYIGLFPLMFKTIIKIYIEVQDLQTGFKQIVDILSKALLQNCNFTQSAAKPAIKCFLDFCLPMDCIYYITQLVNNQSVSRYPHLSTLLFQMLLKARAYQSYLSEQDMKKSLILCAKGFSKINILYLNSAKKYLHYEIQTHFKIKTTRHRSIYKKSVYKKQSCFRDELSKILRMLSKKKAPQLIIQRIQKCFFKVLDCLRFQIKNTEFSDETSK